METAKCLTLLLVGLGVGGISAAEPTSDEKLLSPIFAPAAAAEPALPAKKLPNPSPVSRQLAALIRRDLSAAPPVAAEGPGQEAATSGRDILQLEKMTVNGQGILKPRLKETPLEKFTRTGHLWEFSRTKRLMIGPRGDKVGLMFSFDW